MLYGLPLPTCEALGIHWAPLEKPLFESLKFVQHILHLGGQEDI